MDERLSLVDAIVGFLAEEEPDLEVDHWEHLRPQIRINIKHSREDTHLRPWTLISIYPTFNTIYYLAPSESEYWQDYHCDPADPEYFTKLKEALMVSKKNREHRL